MRSMKRLFAALCESATTTLKNGRFLAPPRASRITTISGSPRVEKGVILREVRGGRQGKNGCRLHQDRGSANRSDGDRDQGARTRGNFTRRPARTFDQPTLRFH